MASRNSILKELKSGKNITDLIEKFRGYLALEVLKAFVDQEALKVLVA